jgi:hypothetical protein
VIRVEPGPPAREARCGACGGTSRLLHGYVYEDEHAHGVYFVEWCEGDHPARAAFLAVGLGAFGEGSGPDGRAAFGIEWRAGGMALTNEPVRDRPELLGAFVPRADALARPDVAHLWHVVDHVVVDDPRLARVRAWLEEG